MRNVSTRASQVSVHDSSKTVNLLLKVLIVEKYYLLLGGYHLLLERAQLLHHWSELGTIYAIALATVDLWLISDLNAVHLSLNLLDISLNYLCRFINLIDPL